MFFNGYKENKPHSLSLLQLKGSRFKLSESTKKLSAGGLNALIVKFVPLINKKYGDIKL